MPPGRADYLSQRVSIRRLKARALAAYEPGVPIREVLAHEPDQMTRGELLDKLGAWLVLIRLAESADGAPIALEKGSHETAR